MLSVLEEGGAWLADFTAVRGYYDALARVASGCCDEKTALQAASLALADQDFPKLTDDSLSMADPTNGNLFDNVEPHLDSPPQALHLHEQAPSRPQKNRRKKRDAGIN
ncbi:MAG: hypothetical protein NTU53_17140 [Planctomycetota bacterium]|nr:hypothetical protein [Planctomycetota bacterium]